MKTVASFLGVLTLSWVSFASYCNAQTDLETFRRLGIVSQLVEIKYVSEAYLARELKKEGAKDTEKWEALKNYNLVRLDLDRVVFQLIAEMNAANSPRLFKKLNRYYKDAVFANSDDAKTVIKPFCDAFKELYEDYETNILPRRSVGSPKFPLAIADIDITGIATFFETTWKDIQDLRHEKVEGVSDLLKSVLLAPPDDDKKEEGKKDDKR